MATFYYIKDKICTLVDRKNNITSQFILKSPNGDGVFDAEIKEIFESKYVDGLGNNAKGYAEYEITATFYYSSHFMELYKLLQADEIIIPFSLGLKNDVDTRFVLENKDMLYNFLFNQSFISDTDKEYPYGNIDLVFTTCVPMKPVDLINLSYYRDPVEPIQPAAPFNLYASSGDTVINASVDAYPEIVDSYNWYLDGVLIATTSDGTPSYQYTGLINEQEYLVGVSVTVNGEESNILDWTNHVYDTLSKGHPTHVITARSNFAHQSYFFNGRTYNVWLSNESPSGIYIYYYDHNTGEISSSVKIASLINADQHLHPVINIDSLGNIYVVVQSEWTENPLWVFKSDLAEDISSWTQTATLSGLLIYPKIYINENDNIFVISQQKHDEVHCFKSTDGGSTFVDQTVVNIGDENRWTYNGIFTTRVNQGIHVFINLQNNTTLAYPDLYYLYSSDGIIFGDIEFYESGGSSGFSKDTSVAPITKTDLDNNCSVILGVDQDAYNKASTAMLDSLGNPYMVISRGNNVNDPDITSWDMVQRESGSWTLTDISSIVSLSDVRGSNVTGIYDLEVLSENDWRVWVQDYVGSQLEITQYRTKNAGSSWAIEEYMTRNSSSTFEPARMVAIGNPYNVSRPVVSATFENGAGIYSDIRTNIKIPALAVPRNKFSLSFDGTNDYVIADQPFDGVLDFTIEAYFKTSTADLGNIVALRQSDIGTDQSTQLLACRILSTGELELLARNSSGTVFSLSTVNTYNTNTWYRAVWSRQGTEFKIRIVDTDGTILETVILAGTSDDVVDATNKLILGTYNTTAGANEWYGGFMDDIRIWDDYRTDTEITDNNNIELVGTKANLVWYAPTKEGSGTVLDDITAGNRDGTINGATWSTDTPF